MRTASILFKNEQAGILSQLDDGTFTFKYIPSWLSDSRKPSISLTLPKTDHEFHSNHLFSFFFNMLPEGTNKLIACKLNRIDQTDYFGLLLTTARYDSIGAVRVIKLEEA
ncbi:MAG: hypothetical protein RIS47_128 [Bacteroidota bacterium]|jgi:serine/threonine-protein kinase HipA